MTQITRESRLDHWIIVCTQCWTYIILIFLLAFAFWFQRLSLPSLRAASFLLLALLQSHHENLIVRGNFEGAKGCEDHYQIQEG